MPKNELWIEYTVDALIPAHGHAIPVCGLCGNSGILDTTGSAKIHDRPCGIKTFCICPNGRALKKVEKNRKDSDSEFLRRMLVGITPVKS